MNSDLSIKELRALRDKFVVALWTCTLKKYDGALLVKPLEELNKIYISKGGHPRPISHATAKYWEDPENKINASKDPNPIVKVDENYNIIRKSHLRFMQPRTAIKEPEPQIIPQQQVTDDSGYYRINISWTDRGNVDRSIVEEMKGFFVNLGLKQVTESSQSNGYDMEHTIEYEFHGSNDAYLILKRSAMLTLDILLARTTEFHIVIHGKKLGTI